MATQPIADSLISVEEYLSADYEPDREYNEGVLEERNSGEFEHSFLQIFLGTLFTNKIAAWGVFALTEQRVQLRPRRYVVPDLTILRMGMPREPIFTRPPLAVIEIMSPKDKKKNAAKKAIEYLDFGVEHVWVIDPKQRSAYRGTRSGLELIPSGELTVEGTLILVRVSELFEKLDQFQRDPVRLQLPDCRCATGTRNACPQSRWKRALACYRQRRTNLPFSHRLFEPRLGNQ